MEVKSYDDLIKTIVEKVDLREYLQREGVHLKPSPQGATCLCMFHKEKTPSFHIFSDTQSFYCFGCKKHGNILTYIMEKNGYDFKTAVSLLAEQYNISLELSPEEKAYNEKLKQAYRATKVLGEFFEAEFHKLPDSHPAKKMITDRGLGYNAVRFGYAPEDTSLLIKFLSPYIKKKEFTPKTLNELGFLLQGKNGRPYIPLKNRLMFYFQSRDDKIEGFTGRALTEYDTKNRKYVNSSNSIIFQKSREIYNLNQARKHIRNENSVYLVEGQFDVAAMIEAGYQNVIAISGTALDKHHIEKINMIFKDSSNAKYILCLDDDFAGQKASRAVFEKNPNIQRKLYITVVPNGKDPCEALGKDKTKKLNEPILYLDYIFNQLKDEYVKNKRTDPYNVINEFGSILAKVPDVLLRESYIQKLSTFTLIPNNVIKQIIGGVDSKSIEILKDLESLKDIHLAEGNYFDKALVYYSHNRNSIPKVYIEKFPEEYQKVLKQLTELKVITPMSLDKNNPITSRLIKNLETPIPNSELEDSTDIQTHYITLVKFGMKDYQKAKEEKVDLLFKQALENAKTPEEIKNAFEILN